MIWFWIVLAVAALLWVLSYLAGNYFFNFAFSAGFNEDMMKKLVAQSGYKDSPHQKAAEKGIELMKTLPREECYVTSFDGLRLHGFYFPVQGEKAPKKFVLGIHGYRSNPWSEYGPHVAFYQAQGYSLLLPDDRGHGASEGKYIGFGNLDRLDCVTWAKYLVERFGEDIEILLHGVSMGGATVLAASGEADLPSQVKGVVADCGFSSIWEEYSHEMKAMYHLPAGFILGSSERICKKRAGFDFHSHSAYEQVQKSRVPILIIHGSADPLVPYWMSKKLYDACPGKKKLFVVEGAGHAQCIGVDPEGYQNAIREMFMPEA